MKKVLIKALTAYQCTAAVILLAGVQIFSSNWDNFDRNYLFGIVICICAAIILVGDYLKGKMLFSLIAWQLLAFSVCIRLEMPATYGNLVLFSLMLIVAVFVKKSGK